MAGIKQPQNGRIVSIYGALPDGTLGHHDAEKDRLNRFIDRHRGKSYEDLKRAMQEATDPEEKDAIRIHASGHFHKDPGEEKE